MERREFLRRTGVSAGALATGAFLGACQGQSVGDEVDAPAIATKKYVWKAVTTWPPNLPVMGEAMVMIAKELEIMSQGRMKIKVYGAGELVPALEVFDAVTQGVAQIGHGAAYYWAGKIPSAVFFASVPFGMNAQQVNAWLFHGGGWDLWRELYHQYGLEPFPAGNTGVQMGGWFNKAINTIDDFKGLKMRMPGLGGKVIAKAGASPLTDSNELYTRLERGNIDATEWIGPYHDYSMGFHRVAKYYYYPGWHEPGTVLEMIVNKEAFDELPADLQEMVRTVALKYNQMVLSEFEAKNNEYLTKMVEEDGVQLKAFPPEVLEVLKGYADEVIQEIVSNDPFALRVYESFRKFKKQVSHWHNSSEKAIMPYL